MRRLPVEYRRSAVDDLLDITAHILDQSQNIISTESYANRIWARCGKIGDAPLGGVAREDLGPGIRMAVFEKSVVILYTVENDTVWITNLFSGGRDYEALLRR